MSVFNMPIKEIHRRLQNKELSVTDLVRNSVERIKAVDEQLNCFITLDEEGALKKAEKLDQQGVQDNPLFGLPMAIKDNISTDVGQLHSSVQCHSSRKTGGSPDGVDGQIEYG